MYAIIKSGGRQYKVSVGQRLEVNRLAVEDGAEVRFGEVLLIGGGDQPLLGSPFVNNAEVVATAVGPARGEKLTVFRYKSKKRFRHRRGHRQELTVLAINDILSNGKSLVSDSEKKAAAPAPKAERKTSAAPAATAEPETEVVTEAPAEEKKPARRRRSTKQSAENSTEE